MVTKQIPAGTVAASGENAGVEDENSSTVAAPAGAPPNARPNSTNPGATSTATTRRITPPKARDADRRRITPPRHRRAETICQGTPASRHLNRANGRT